MWRNGLWRAAQRDDGEGEGEPGNGEDEPADDLEDAPVRDEPAPEDIVLSPEDEALLREKLAAAPEDTAALALVGLVRSGTHVGVNRLRRLFWARPLSAEEAAAAEVEIHDYDEDKVLLDSAVKASDGFFTTFFVSTYSRYIARWAAHRGFTPNQVTTVSLFIGIAAAAAFATGERWGLVAGAILLQAAFTTDCVDGQLARYTRTFSKLGAWLDSMFDRSKEYVCFAGLAIGASRAGDPVWTLACAAITLQTARHFSDFSFGAGQTRVVGLTEQPPVERALDAGGIAAAERRARAGEEPAAEDGAAEPRPAPVEAVPLSRRVLRGWHRIDRLPGVRWVKKMAAFPIGERFAAISVTAALFDAAHDLRRAPVLGRLRRPVHPERARAALDRPMTAHRRARRGAPGAPEQRRGLPRRPVGRARHRPGARPAASRCRRWSCSCSGSARSSRWRPSSARDASLGVAAAGVAWLLLTMGTTSARWPKESFHWAVPPLVRLGEYATLAWLAAIDDAVPAAFALIAALTFRHYDLVYRLRHRAEVPPAWLNRLAAGWDGRVIIAWVLLALGTLPAAMYVWAGLLGAVSVAEAAVSWRRFERSRATAGEFDELEGEAG